VTSAVVARGPHRASASIVSGALAALVALAVPAHARAQSCAGVDERLSFVRERLRADAHDARVWAWAWGVGFTALALGQAGLALTRDDRGERAELYIGAGKTVLGLVPVLFVPVPAVRDAPALEARLAGQGAEARCALLPAAELMLERSADDEAFGRGWLAHAATFAVNAGGLLIVGFGYHRWVTGAVGAVVGTAVGELQIFTRPTGALDARRGTQGRWTVAPLLERNVAGIRVVALFGP
jgi:hypothetical protein